LATTAVVRSAAAVTRQAFQIEDYLQWAVLATKGPFLFTPEPLTRYRVHSQSSSYSTSQEYLNHLYRMIEFLLSLHALTDNPELRVHTESELLYNLGLIRNIYIEGASSGVADSVPKSCHSAEKVDGSSWDQSALKLQSQVNALQAQVRELSERLTTIRGSRVYRSLVKARNLLITITSWNSSH
jgi:hypothetical protein